MMELRNLSEVIKLNGNFKNAVNIYLNLNQKDKILSYIPTNSSVRILDDFLRMVYENREQATLLIGPYGKGKSHLLLVLLAILSLERTDENQEIIAELVKKIRNVDEAGESLSGLIWQVWNEKRKFLPVIIMSTQGDLNQAFLYALHDALKRFGLEDLVPDTYYSVAIRKIIDWKENFPETYEKYQLILKGFEKTSDEMFADLHQYNKTALDIFSGIYSMVTSGGDFTPMASSGVLPLYKSVAERLNQEYNFGGLYIVFDEFSKFIEGQDHTIAGNNMKLLQDICELAADSHDAQIHITMVAHKSIKEYGKYLSQDIINSFTGIEGRITEKLFVTSSKNNYELIKNAIIKDDDRIKKIPQYQAYLGDRILGEYYALPPFKTNFSREDFRSILLRGCYPLNPIGAYLLLNISEKVAQNERTLFTFISKNERYSMARFVETHREEDKWIIGADLIYDYFSNLFKNDVNNEFIHNEWLNAEYAVSKCQTEDQKCLLKTLALILIVNKEEEMPASEKVLWLASNVVEYEKVLGELTEMQLIYKKGSTNNYMFKTRAGSELKKEIKERRILKGNNVNLSQVFLSITDRYYIIPKRYNQEMKMTRYFRHEYMEKGDFLNIADPNAFFDGSKFADGKVISLYSLEEDNKYNEVKNKLETFKDSRIVVCYSSLPFTLLKQARDYEILQDLKKNSLFLENYEVLAREIPILEEDLAKELYSALEAIYTAKEECKTIFYDGTKITEMEAEQEEIAVNRVCRILYPRTPIINNEIINRRSIETGPTKKSRRVIIKAILEHTDNENFYAGSSQEATLYRSLFKVTNILCGTPDENMGHVLELMDAFIESCSDQKRLLSELVKELTGRPYGMRMGVIPLYFAYVLSRRKEDIVVYFKKMEVQISSDIVINMIDNAEAYSLFVSGQSLQKERYVKSLQDMFFIENHLNLTDFRFSNILICMQRWFRALPQVSRNLPVFEGYALLEEVKGYLGRFKNIIQKTDANPYELLFEQLPELFQSKEDLDNTAYLVEKCKQAFDGYYEWLLKNVALYIFEIFGSQQIGDLYHVLKEWYNKQNATAKHGLLDGKITEFMSCLSKLNVYDDFEITKRIAKVVTDVYIENWNEDSFKEFKLQLERIKREVESIQDDSAKGKQKLSFIGEKNRTIECYYEPVGDGVGKLLKNVLEDTLEDFSDLSVNDRVAIMLQLIEKIIG